MNSNILSDITFVDFRTSYTVGEIILSSEACFNLRYVPYSFTRYENKTLKLLIFTISKIIYLNISYLLPSPLSITFILPLQKQTKNKIKKGHIRDSKMVTRGRKQKACFLK
jgi:hypothetical protein